MVEFGGWDMPLNYPPGILAEHLATRRHGGLFDVSHMGRLLIGGRGGLPFLQHVLSNNAASLLPEQAQYTIIPTESGGARDDAFLYRLDESQYILVVNASNLKRDWQWLNEQKKGFRNVVLRDISGSMAMISLQGPKAKAVMEAVVGSGGNLPEPMRNALAIVTIMGAEVPVARTGYTGEPLTFELFPPTKLAAPLFRRLLEEEGREAGIVPVGLGARNTLRLEAGLPLYGHELGEDEDGKEIPIFALPLARTAVSLSSTKGDFIGRQALTDQFLEMKLRQDKLLDTPPDEQLIPRTIMPMTVFGGIARRGCPVYVEEKRVGVVTSGTIAPYWKTEGCGAKAKPGDYSDKRAVCLAYVDSELDKGQPVRVIIRNKASQGMIVHKLLDSRTPPYARPLLAEPVPANA